MVCLGLRRRLALIKIFGIIAVAVVTCILLLLILRVIAFCGPELAERVEIPNSDLEISTQVVNCSVIDAGRTEIFIENRKTKERSAILVLDEEVDSRVTFSNNVITISLPNMVNIIKQENDADGLHVSYDYLPKDDPEERANYKKWVHNPRDPEENDWYRKHLLEKIQPQAR